MNGRRWSVLSSKGQLSTARLLPRASICVWSPVWVGFSVESAMANLEPNRSGSANNVSMTSSWHTYSSSHNFVRPPSPAPILTGQAKPCRGGVARQRRCGQLGEIFTGLTTPSAPPLRSAQPPLLCEEGNVLGLNILPEPKEQACYTTLRCAPVAAPKSHLAFRGDSIRRLPRALPLSSISDQIFWPSHRWR